MCLEIRTQVEDRENRRGGEAEAEKHILCCVLRPAGETARTEVVFFNFYCVVPIWFEP